MQTATETVKATATIIFRIKGHDSDNGRCKPSAVRGTARSFPGFKSDCITDRDGVTFTNVGNWNNWAASFNCPTCDSRFRAYGQTLKGKANPAKVCSAKCVGATGFDCECECGGDNHGRNWG